MRITKNIYATAALLTFVLLTGPSLFAQNTGGGKTGLGVMLGEPTGVNLKSWNNAKTAWDMGLAWSLSDNDEFHVHVSHLWHHWLKVDKGNLAVYYGIGGRITLFDHSHLGLRIPVGLNYLIANAPLDLFLEVAPIIDLIPDTESDVNGAIGIRFYF